MIAAWRLPWLNRFQVAEEPVARIRLGGFNLLPYRQRNARLARRRRVLEWLAAVFAGCVAVLVLAGWQAWERTRLDARRHALERTLSQLRAPLTEHAALLRARDEERKGVALAKGLAEPLTHLRDLLEALSFEPGDGVVLRQFRQREYDTELLATSRGHAASAEWLKRLSAIRGVRGAEVSDLHPITQRGIASAKPDAGASASAVGPIEFGAHLRWRDAVQQVSAKAGTGAARAARKEQAGGEK